MTSYCQPRRSQIALANRSRMSANCRKAKCAECNLRIKTCIEARFAVTRGARSSTEFAAGSPKLDTILDEAKFFFTVVIHSLHISLAHHFPPPELLLFVHRCTAQSPTSARVLRIRDEAVNQQLKL